MQPLGTGQIYVGHCNLSESFASDLSLFFVWMRKGRWVTSFYSAKSCSWWDLTVAGRRIKRWSCDAAMHFWPAGQPTWSSCVGERGSGGGIMYANVLDGDDYDDDGDDDDGDDDDDDDGDDDDGDDDDDDDDDDDGGGGGSDGEDEDEDEDEDDDDDDDGEEEDDDDDDGDGEGA